MSSRLSRAGLLFFTIVTGIPGCLAGAIFGLTLPHAQSTVAEYPLPHHIPKFPGNLTLRFVMVHDVIHERFDHHGKDYYKERNRLAERGLEEERAKTPAGSNFGEKYFFLADDLGVGLVFLGEYDKAVQLMRDKLKTQQAQGLSGRNLYSTYANLGTFLVLWQLSEGLPGGPGAKKRLQESVDWIHKAIEVYPESHFGREVWQAVLEEFLMAVIDNPQLLLEYDMVGNRLKPAIDTGRWDEHRQSWDTFGYKIEVAAYLQNPLPGDHADGIRVRITRVGAEKGWNEKVKTSKPEPAPFDEPTLGIIGMWRMGAGANPFFALALGEIMLRVGQRYIAWCAYERAEEMNKGIWPDPAIQKTFAEHCLARKKIIEQQFPQEDWTQIRKRYQEELAYGKQYQGDYQKYEAKCIAEGVSLEDPHFYDAFYRDHEPIASPVGDEDKFIVEMEGKRPILPAALFGAGLFSLVTALILRRFVTRTQNPYFRD